MAQAVAQGMAARGCIPRCVLAHVPPDLLQLRDLTVTVREMTPAERDHPNVLHLEEEVEGPPVPEMASPRGERDHDALEGGERLEPATTARGSSTTAMTSGSSRVTMEAVAPTAGATAKPRAKRANRKWPPYSPCC